MVEHLSGLDIRCDDDRRRIVEIEYTDKTKPPTDFVSGVFCQDGSVTSQAGTNMATSASGLF
jgi:hypothetical protein